MNQVIIKNSDQLTDNETEQLEAAFKREFQVTFPLREKMTGRFVFLLKDNEKILATGQLLPVEPILFNGEEFHVLGIGGIIANEEGQGFGKQIMTAISSQLTSQNKTGVGFCKLKNKGFYEKCGFLTDTRSLNRFIYKGENPMKADEENQCIFYQDSSDHFMEKVLKIPSKVVTIPIPPVW